MRYPRLSGCVICGVEGATGPLTGYPQWKVSGRAHGDCRTVLDATDPNTALTVLAGTLRPDLVADYQPRTKTVDGKWVWDRIVDWEACCWFHYAARFPLEPMPPAAPFAWLEGPPLSELVYDNQAWERRQENEHAALLNMHNPPVEPAPARTAEEAREVADRITAGKAGKLATAAIVTSMGLEVVDDGKTVTLRGRQKR